MGDRCTGAGAAVPPTVVCSDDGSQRLAHQQAQRRRHAVADADQRLQLIVDHSPHLSGVAPGRQAGGQVRRQCWSGLGRVFGASERTHVWCGSGGSMSRRKRGERAHMHAAAVPIGLPPTWMTPLSWAVSIWKVCSSSTTCVVGTRLTVWMLAVAVAPVVKEPITADRRAGGQAGRRGEVQQGGGIGGFGRFGELC